VPYANKKHRLTQVLSAVKSKAIYKGDSLYISILTRQERNSRSLTRGKNEQPKKRG